MKVTVYSKPDCRQCDATKRELTLRGVEFELDDALEPANLEAIRSLGMTGAPVVVVLPDGASLGQEDVWSGLRPDRIMHRFGPRPRVA